MALEPGIEAHVIVRQLHPPPMVGTIAGDVVYGEKKQFTLAAAATECAAIDVHHLELQPAIVTSPGPSILLATEFAELKSCESLARQTAGTQSFGDCLSAPLLSHFENARTVLRTVTLAIKPQARCAIYPHPTSALHLNPSFFRRFNRATWARSSFNSTTTAHSLS